MKPALVLAGGGAKGSFQAGALKYLFEKSFEFSSVFGVSVGALNGAMVATGQGGKLQSIWQTTRDEDVYRKHSYYKLAKRYIMHKIGIGKAPRSLYGNEPLRQLMLKQLQGKKLLIPFNAGRVELESGEYFSSMNGIPEDSDTYIDTILSSTAIPVIWEPVKLGDSNHYVDGGIRNITPIGEVLKKGAEKVVIITTQPRGESPSGYDKDLFDIADRTINIMLDTIFEEDISRFLDINDFVRQAQEEGATLTKNGREMKYIEHVIIEPATGLGSALDFNKGLQQQRYNHGYNQARNALNNNPS